MISVSRRKDPLEIAFPLGWHNTDISDDWLSVSLSSTRSPFSSFFRALARDRYYFQAAWRGLLKARGWVGTLAQGWIGCFAARNTLHYTVGVVYIRDYFSFLSSLLSFLSVSHFILLFSPSSPFSGVLLAFQRRREWVLRSDVGEVSPLSVPFFFFFEKLRKISCTTLGASLRDSLREMRREKNRLSAWIKN